MHDRKHHFSRIPVFTEIQTAFLGFLLMVITKKVITKQQHYVRALLVRRTKLFHGFQGKYIVVYISPRPYILHKRKAEKTK